MDFIENFRQAALDRRQSEGDVGRGGGCQHDAVDIGLGDHRLRIGEALSPGLDDRSLESSGVRVGYRNEDRIGVVGDDPKVVPAHRTQPGQAEPQLRSHERLPVPTAWRRTDARRASTTCRCSTSVRPGYMGRDMLPAAAASVLGRSASMPSSIT